MARDSVPPNSLLDFVVSDVGQIPPGLTPANLMFVEGVPLVCLLDMGEAPLRAPFFGQDVERRLSEPNGAPRAVVDIATFTEYCARAARLTPSGFVFHISRCGSTLMAQMLAAVDRHMVVSEPEIVNDILLLADELLAREQRLNLLKLVIGGLGTLPNGADRSRFFIKFSSWNVLALSAIRALFPAVPWVFVYRDPIEVMVSALGSSTGWLRTKHDRGRLLRFMGFSAEDAARLDDTEYSARVLGRFFESALEAPASERALLPYARMPEGVLEVIEGHFRIDLSNAERAAIMAVSAYDSKSGAGQRFRPDAESKRAQADARVHAASARWVDESYAALQARGT